MFVLGGLPVEIEQVFRACRLGPHGTRAKRVMPETLILDHELLKNQMVSSAVFHLDSALSEEPAAPAKRAETRKPPHPAPAPSIWQYVWWFPNHPSLTHAAPSTGGAKSTSHQTVGNSATAAGTVSSTSAGELGKLVVTFEMPQHGIAIASKLPHGMLIWWTPA